MRFVQETNMVKALHLGLREMLLQPDNYLFYHFIASIPNIYQNAETRFRLTLNSIDQ